MPKGVYKRTEEHNRKNAEAKKGNTFRKGIKHSEEAKKKISKSKKKQGLKPRLGIKHTEKTKQKISGSRKKNPTRYWLGKARLDMRGKNSPHWKGGVSKERTRIWHSLKYKKWRKQIFERDEFTCRECGRIGGKLEAHHIMTFGKYPKLRFVINNGISLCEECHKQTRGKEEQFEKYFINKLQKF